MHHPDASTIEQFLPELNIKSSTKPPLNEESHFLYRYNTYEFLPQKNVRNKLLESAAKADESLPGRKR